MERDLMSKLQLFSRDQRVVDYISCSRIVASHNLKNEHVLLEPCSWQASTAPRPACIFESGGWIVLDFGCQLHGGIEIINYGLVVFHQLVYYKTVAVAIDALKTTII